jgi:hypothetical protein
MDREQKKLVREVMGNDAERNRRCGLFHYAHAIERALDLFEEDQNELEDLRDWYADTNPPTDD